MEKEQRIGAVQQETKGFAKTQVFLRTALAEGAHLKIPFWIARGGYIGYISEEVWVRQKNIIGVYFGSPASLEDIGRIYGVTRERISQLIEKGMLHTKSV